MQFSNIARICADLPAIGVVGGIWLVDTVVNGDAWDDAEFGGVADVFVDCGMDGDILEEKYAVCLAFSSLSSNLSNKVSNLELYSKV